MEFEWGFGNDNFDKIYNLFDGSGVSIQIEQNGKGGAVTFAKKLNRKKIRIEWDRNNKEYLFEKFYEDLVKYKKRLE